LVKFTSFIVFCILITTISLPIQAQKLHSLNVNGLWEDVNNSNFSNGHMIISQDAELIYVTHYVEFKGLPLVEYGIGTRTGNTIEYKVKVTQKIPGWTTEGMHTLTISEDGTMLTGHYTSGGKKGPLEFKKAGK